MAYLETVEASQLKRTKGNYLMKQIYQTGLSVGVHLSKLPIHSHLHDEPISRTLLATHHLTRPIEPSGVRFSFPYQLKATLTIIDHHETHEVYRGRSETLQGRSYPCERRREVFHCIAK